MRVSGFRRHVCEEFIHAFIIYDQYIYNDFYVLFIKQDDKCNEITRDKYLQFYDAWKWYLELGYESVEYVLN